MSDSFDSRSESKKILHQDKSVNNVGNKTADDKPPEQVFRSIQHITKLCEDCSVNIGLLGNYNYPKGWCVVVEDLIRELRGFDITITEVMEHFGRLVVRFNTEDQQVEIKAWRAINEADIRASHTCEMCGEKGTLAVHRNFQAGVLCGSCKDKFVDKKSGSSKRTGTWLDYF